MQSHLPLSVSKWLRQVGVDEVQLRSLPWTKLTDENRRKGVWWLPSHDEVLPGARKLDGGSLHGLELGTDEGVNLMQAAAEQVVRVHSVWLPWMPEPRASSFPGR